MNRDLECSWYCLEPTNNTFELNHATRLSWPKADTGLATHLRGHFNLSAKERETPLDCSWSIAAEVLHSARTKRRQLVQLSSWQLTRKTEKEDGEKEKANERPRRRCPGPTATYQQMNKYLGSRTNIGEGFICLNWQQVALHIHLWGGSKLRMELVVLMNLQIHFVQNPNSRWKEMIHWMAGRRSDKWQN